VFAFNARSGTVPLPLGRFWGQATWGIFRDRLLLLVRDRLPGELPARWGQAAEGF